MLIQLAGLYFAAYKSAVLIPAFRLTPASELISVASCSTLSSCQYFAAAMRGVNPDLSSSLVLLISLDEGQADKTP
jgi:hypothetical protein